MPSDFLFRVLFLLAYFFNSLSKMPMLSHSYIFSQFPIETNQMLLRNVDYALLFIITNVMKDANILNRHTKQ